ncbi:MAG: HpcH/HpaI aldolase/citrate lyase family protein [Alphaproteobacteria bacterium]|nr:HpcH/HpaI aldolase/citrate lyase family protein [Alphaproteobacteria bacterium]
MDMPRNAFKHALAQGRRQIGLWSSLGSNIAAEILAPAGFDWILLDMEHSSNEIPMLIQQMQALTGGTATAIVRPPWNDAVTIKRVLDAGAQSILVPFVQNAAEARAAVAATRYPPHGIRGVATGSRGGRYGRIDGYLGKANAEMCVLVQIETPMGITNLEAIASVEGVDGVFIGPSDLAATHGHLGNPGHPDVDKLIFEAGARLKKLGKPAGFLTPNEALARRVIEAGFLFVAVGSDNGLLVRSADALANSFKG